MAHQGSVAEQRQPDERRADERLVGDRVGHDAEVGDLAAAAREVAVDDVGEAGQRRTAPPRARGRRRRCRRAASSAAKNGHDEQPAEGQHVGQVEHEGDGRAGRAVVRSALRSRGTCQEVGRAGGGAGPAAGSRGRRPGGGRTARGGAGRRCSRGRLDLRHVPDVVEQVQCPVRLQRGELRHAGDGHQAGRACPAARCPAPSPTPARPR